MGRQGTGRLAQLGFKSYDAYLRSAGWRTRRRKAGKAAGWTCACGHRATEIHHRIYERVGNESPKDLRAVCAECHAEIHRRKDAGMSLAAATDAVINATGRSTVRLEPGPRTKAGKGRLSKKEQRRLARAKRPKGPAKTPSRKGGKLGAENDRLHQIQVRNRERQNAARRERDFAVSSGPAGAPGGSSGSTRSPDRA